MDWAIDEVLRAKNLDYIADKECGDVHYYEVFVGSYGFNIQVELDSEFLCCTLWFDGGETDIYEEMSQDVKTYDEADELISIMIDKTKTLSRGLIKIIRHLSEIEDICEDIDIEFNSLITTNIEY